MTLGACKRVSAGDHEHLSTALAEGKISAFIPDVAAVLAAESVSKSELKRILMAFKLLEKMPKSQWIDILLPLMSRITRILPDGNTAFFEQDQFPWVQQVQEQWSAIVEELDAVMGKRHLIPAFQEIQSDQTAITNDDLWKVIVFRGYGDDLSTNCKAFPVIKETLDLIPGWTSAMVSILEPGKRIPPHTGVYNGVLRYQLGIKIPDDCAIKVKGELRTWQEGGSLIFDDTFEHEAWNLSQEPRAVLFVDFLRPLPSPLDILNEFVVLSLIKDSPFITESKVNEYKYHQLLDSLNE